MTEYLSVHSIIYETTDDDDNVKYYTTGDEFDHSWMCDAVDLEDLDEIKDNFKIKYARKNGEGYEN
jgi:hypothetical protein